MAGRFALKVAMNTLAPFQPCSWHKTHSLDWDNPEWCFCRTQITEQEWLVRSGNWVIGRNAEEVLEDREILAALRRELDSSPKNSLP